jgi:hypothetical protein
MRVNSSINHSNGERIGFFLLVAFIGTLVWSLLSR